MTKIIAQLDTFQNVSCILMVPFFGVTMKNCPNGFSSVTTDATHFISSKIQNISVKGAASIQDRVETVSWLIVLRCSECSIKVSETGEMLLSA